MLKTPVVIQKHYTIYFEMYEGLTWTHADVHKWTPKVAREFKYAHNLLSIIHGRPFYCVVDNDKLKKFVIQLGYTFEDNALCIDNLTRSIYKYG